MKWPVCGWWMHFQGCVCAQQMCSCTVKKKRPPLHLVSGYRSLQFPFQSWDEMSELKRHAALPASVTIRFLECQMQSGTVPGVSRYIMPLTLAPLFQSTRAPLSDPSVTSEPFIYSSTNLQIGALRPENLECHSSKLSRGDTLRPCSHMLHPHSHPSPMRHWLNSY